MGTRHKTGQVIYSRWIPPGVGNLLQAGRVECDRFRAHLDTTRNTTMKPKQLLAMLAIVALASCGSGGGAKKPDTQVTEAKPVESSIRKILNIIVPSAFADDFPISRVQASATTKLKDGNSVTLYSYKKNDSGNWVFDSMDYGEYDVKITYYNGDTVLAEGAKHIFFNENKTVEIPLTIKSGSLLVNPIFDESTADKVAVDGKYQAVARSKGCIKNEFSDSFGFSSASAIIEINGDTLDATIEIFPKNTIKISASMANGKQFLTGLGTFKSSDFTEGAATIDKIVQIESSTLYLSATLQGECTTEIDITGFRVGS